MTHTDPHVLHTQGCPESNVGKAETNAGRAHSAGCGSCC